MDNSETYIINLKKDYGRYLSSQNIVEIFGGSFIEAYDCNDIDKNGYVINWKDMTIYTQSAKQTKRKILENFYNKSNKQYIVIFEDDIYLHHDLFNSDKKNIIFDQINQFLNNRSPALLYFGITKEFTSSNNDTSKIKFISFIDKFDKNIKLCPGAFGFVLRRDMIPFVLIRIDNPIFFNNPFDIYCLSYISYMYPSESYVLDPQLVVPDISHSNIRKNFDQTLLWKKLGTSSTNYMIPIIGIMYVKVMSDKSFYFFNKMITCITPIIKILYYGDNYKNKNIFDSLTDAKKEKIFTSRELECNIYTNTNVLIKHYSGKKLLDLIFFHKKYKKLKIVNGHNIELFLIEYFNSEILDHVVTCDL